MASANTTTAQKQCGVCSKPIITGYFTYGDYCGLTVCMQCMSKNTWSMCRKCNGSLLDYSHVPTTVPDSEIEGKSSDEINATYIKAQQKLSEAHERIYTIYKFAHKIVSSAEVAMDAISSADKYLRDAGHRKYIAQRIKEEKAGLKKFFELYHLPSSSVPKQFKSNRYMCYY